MFYKTGGTLPIESSSYVERSADLELEIALKKGKLCYVLNSRQMGKSSLAVRVSSRLRAEGKICIIIDLCASGKSDLNVEKWYGNVILTIVNNCPFEYKWKKKWIEWWKENQEFLTPKQRLSWFIEKILLIEIKSNIVIFFDEIDSVLSLDFSSVDFFDLIHRCYQERHFNSNYSRLTFALLGVTSPRNLLDNRNDRSCSLFELELAEHIHLQGFKLEEAVSLMGGFPEEIERPKEVLAEIIRWTAGQPYLTHKICELVAETDSVNKLNIANIIEKYIIKNWQAQDEHGHLKTIRDRLYHNNYAKTICLLSLYQNILQKKVVPVDNSIEQIELFLSGLVVKRKGYLEVNNPIYAKVFNLAWVKKQLAELRPYHEKLFNWINSNDPVYLLKGEDLQDALDWAGRRTLTDIDRQFLGASQELAKQKVEETLSAEKSANQLLANARKKAVKKVKQQRLSKKWLSKIVLGVTGFILLLRCTGILQIWEWNLLDRFFRWRLVDALEPRIVVVTIDEKDLQTVKQYPISDRVLATIIKNLNQARPNAIALDLYRDLPVPPGYPDLSKVFSSTANLYVTEKVISNTIPPPPNVSRHRVGFSNLAVDTDGRVRRALLSINDEDSYKYSLGTKLALHYLHQQNIEPTSLDKNYRRYGLGKVIFERLNRNSGGYIRADATGYQILLNYWGTQANFKQYTLIDVLNNRFNPEDIRDRLIFIGSGSNAESSEDNFYTPYSKGWFRSPSKMPGVFVHANVASQIISTAIDRRPLLRTHNQVLESLIILCTGVVGAIISWRLRSFIAIAFNTCVVAIILIVIYYRAFLLGWWLPLVPALLTLLVVVITAILIRNKQREHLKFKHTLKLVLAESQSDRTVAIIALKNLKRSESRDNSYLVEKHIKRLNS